MRKIIYLIFCLTAISLTVNGQDRIYWGIFSNSLKSAKFDGSDLKQLGAVPSGCYDMETDFYKNEMYWGDGVYIKKGNTDGTNVQILYTTPSGFTGGLALDLANKKLYFGIRGVANVLICQCNLDGTDLKTIATSPLRNGQSYTLSISTTLQKLYWTEQNGSASNSVLRCNLDGSNIEVLMTVANFMPGLTIDDKNQKLYLAYYSDNKVMMTDMTCSTTPTVIMDQSYGTFQMVVNNIENKLYYASMSNYKIGKCNLDGTSPETIITDDSGYIIALSIPTVPPAPTIVENETDTLKVKDFLFSGIDIDAMSKIQITALPEKGTLYLDANNNDVVDDGEAIVLNQEINKTDITAGLLKFNPVANDYGTPYCSFNFKWYNGTDYSTLEYTQSVYVIKYVAGDISRNGVIDGNEIAGDVNKNGVIDRPSEVAGDTDGDGMIDNGEIAGDLNGNGTIDRPTEVAGDLNGNGVIDRPTEVAGDIDGDGTITAPELAGDVNGNKVIDNGELLGDLNGNGVLDDTTTMLKNLNNNGLAVYPTITSDAIKITGRNNEEVNIYNAAGILMLKIKADKINLGEYGKGTYFVVISNSATRVIVK